MYVSPPDTQTLDKHADPYDVIVLQLTGRKDWWVCGENISSSNECRELSLPSGHLLSIPAGAEHAATAGPEGSVHLTLCLRAETLAGSAMEKLRTARQVLSSAVGAMHEARAPGPRLHRRRLGDGGAWLYFFYGVVIIVWVGLAFLLAFSLWSCWVRGYAGDPQEAGEQQQPLHAIVPRQDWHWATPGMNGSRPAVPIVAGVVLPEPASDPQEAGGQQPLPRGWYEDYDHQEGAPMSDVWYIHF